ncbi:hypothetical protein BDR06DRAFT_900113, partial [Suillus hirtellus]
WHVLYPAHHYTHPQKCTHTITLVNSKLNTDTWSHLAFSSSDIIIVQGSSNNGKIAIFDIYNTCKNQDTLTAISHFLK